MTDIPSPDIPVLILCGGLGTRLRQVTGDGQKCVAEVAGRPFIQYLLDQIAEQGFGEAILCVGYQHQQVKDLIGVKYRGLRLSYSVETSPLGTGGAVLLALKHVSANEILVMNGDSYCQVDLKALVANSRETGALATIVVRRVEDTSRYGKVTLNEAGLIEQFVEKMAASGSGLINAGVYFFHKDLVTQEIRADGASSLEQDLLPRICDGRLRAFQISSSTFIDIGTPASFSAAQVVFDSHPTPDSNQIKELEQE